MPRWVILAVTLAIVLDQALKQWMLDLVFEPPRVLEVTPFFNLVPVYNTGVSFGLLGSGGASRWILVALALVIVAVLAVWLVRASSNFVRIGLTMVISGALSNVIDRLIYGAVVDFLDVHVAGFHWPAFNLADSLIVVGTAILLYDGLFGAPRALK